MPLDPTRYARVVHFVKDARVEHALLAFAAAIPWARDPGVPGACTYEDMYVINLAYWTDRILHAYERGCAYYGISSGLDDGYEFHSTTWLALDELIRCKRPEGVAYRTLLQQATTLTDQTAESSPFERTGWYDNGRVQSWVFVFWRATSPAASPDPASVNHS